MCTPCAAHILAGQAAPPSNSCTPGLLPAHLLRCPGGHQLPAVCVQRAHCFSPTQGQDPTHCLSPTQGQDCAHCWGFHSNSAPCKPLSPRELARAGQTSLWLLIGEQAGSPPSAPQLCPPAIGRWWPGRPGDVRTFLPEVRWNPHVGNVGNLKWPCTI